MKKFKSIVKYTSYVLAFIAVYFYLGMVVMPKDTSDAGGSKYYSAVAISKEKDNSLDVLYMGDSNVYSDINPLEIYKQTGVRGFCCSFGHQSINAVKNQLKKLLKKQSPKLIVLDTDCLYEKNTFLVGSNVYDYISLGALIEYHSRWKELEWKDFYTTPKAQRDKYKGYVYDTAAYNVVLPADFMKTTDKVAKLKKSVEKDFKELVKICEGANAKLLLVHCPVKKWSMAKANAIQVLADKYGLEYFDMNTNYNEVGIDFSTDYVAKFGTHMNYSGATKVSTYIANLINERILNNTYELDDYRGTEEGKEWDELLDELDEKGADKYYKKLKDM